MIIKRSMLPTLLVVCLLLTSCVTNDSKQGDYDQTKKMIVDILKSDDGKKALQEVLTDDEFQQELVLEQPIIVETIEKTLVSEKGRQFWKDSFKNPKFAESFAESFDEAHSKLLKDLLNDPEYRAKINEIFTDPKTKEDLLNLFKSNDYREHLQTVIKETFENPLFLAKIEDILIKGAENLQESTDKKQEKDNKKEDTKNNDDDED